MRFAHSVLFMAAVFSVQNCSKKLKSSSGGYSSAVLAASADALPANSLPTRPNGGDVIGKGTAIDLEAAEARRNANMVQPIVFGQSVAGIKMTTKYSEAQSILNYYASAGGRDFYGEHVAVFWGAGTDPVPLAVFILEGYGNTLDLPAPYGKLAAGQSLTQYVSTPEDARQFFLAMGTAVEGQGPGYNCEASLTCDLAESADAYIFQYRRGGLRVSKAPPYSLEFIYFVPLQKFYARSTDTILYNLSIAGATFQTKRTTFETRYGPSNPGFGGFELYDRDSVAIIWGVNNTPTTMAANNTYQGTMNFGATIGNRKINDSFKSFAPANDNGTELMKAVVRGALNKPAAFDCTTAVAPELCTLEIDVENGLLIVFVGRSNFIFTNDAERTFLQYQVSAP